MPKYSAWTRHGHLRFSSKKPFAKVIYDDKVANWGDGENYSSEWGSAFSAELYAESMAEARVKHAIVHAGNQFDPTKARALLPKLERETGVVPVPGSTVEQRQTVVAATMRVSRGAREENVVSILQELLGDAFIAYVPSDDYEQWIEYYGLRDEAEVGNWVPPGTPALSARVLGDISIGLGSPQTFQAEAVAGDLSAFRAGQSITIDVADWNRVETVTINAVFANLFNATFDFPHDPGTLFYSGRAPNLATIKRHNTVILSAEGIMDAEIRRKANRALHRLLRGVSTWSLCAEPDGNGFRVEEGLIGATPIFTEI